MNHWRNPALRSVFCAALCFAPAAMAQEAETASFSYYARCLALSEKDPAAALLFARDWQEAGALAAASHCRALALAAQGKYRQAAALLEKLGGAAESGGAKERQVLLLQAADARLLGGDTGRAIDLADKAFALNGGAAPLMLRARAFMLQADWQKAAADLVRARSLAQSEAGVLRDIARLEEAMQAHRAHSPRTSPSSSSGK